MNKKSTLDDASFVHIYISHPSIIGQEGCSSFRNTTCFFLLHIKSLVLRVIRVRSVNKNNVHGWGIPSFFAIPVVLVSPYYTFLKTLHCTHLKKMSFLFYKGNTNIKKCGRTSIMCMGQCMVGMTEKMSGSMIAIMGLSMGVGVAIGLALLAGTFYLIWRFIRALEKR